MACSVKIGLKQGNLDSKDLSYTRKHKYAYLYIYIYLS